jgi:protease-4
MSFEADLLVDRRRLRRRLLFWRSVAFVAALVAVAALGLAAMGRGELPGAERIARIEVTGAITGDRPLLALFDAAREDASVRAVIVAINSPGGTVTGSEAVYEAVRRLAEARPTVAVIDDVGASGGYIAALAAERIVARSSTIVGSIGVIAQFPNVSRLLGSIGVDFETLRSSPLKAAPSGFEPTSPEARAALEAIVRDNYDWFRALVRERRGLDEAELARVADGRVFTARQALPLKLIDAIGDERAAIAWLEKERGVAPGLPVITMKRRPEEQALSLFGFAADFARALGAEGLAAVLEAGQGLKGGGGAGGVLFLWAPAER